MSAVWLNRHPDICDHGHMWDQTQVAELVDSLEDPHLSVYVVAGRFHASPDDVTWVRDHLTYPCVLIVTSDEESLFPWWEFQDPQIALWVMTPRPSHIAGHGPPDVCLGEGYPPDTRELLRHAGYTSWRERPLDWMFAGQVTHKRREQMAAVLADHGGRGLLLATQSFAAGLPRDEYYRQLTQSRVAPAPAGPETPDSFRAYEAWMAGAVPVLDAKCPAYMSTSYWPHVAPGGHWVLFNWASFPGYLEAVLSGEGLEGQAPSWVQEPAWWSMHQRALRRRLRADTGAPHPCNVTVVIPTSPIPSHPDPTVLVETVESAMVELPDADVLIVADGVRDEQAHLKDAYHDYLHHVAWLSNVVWERTALLVLPGHRHQALALRAAMDHVDTPHVLMMEHDTPLQGAIPWGSLERLLTTGEADMVRFLHESRILPDYEHLMMGGVETPCGVRARRTMQWSQRPHLATSAFYRRVLSTYFGSESRTMVEDVMHGVVKNLVEADSNNWLSGFRLWVLHEEDEHGSIQRSGHLDGRDTEPMYPNVFAYPGDTPLGAPAPTAGRVD